MEAPLRRALPGVVQWVCDYGARGVQIFFVISGFVIAHSLREFSATWRSLGSFAIRRQMRLDPAYWVTIALTLVVTYAENRIPSLQAKPMPTLGALIANMFYLQGFTRTIPIVRVAWTLCIEIQFYLVFVALLMVAGRLRNRIVGRKVLATLVFGLGVASLVRTFWTVESPWFFPFWCYFAGGAICYWTVTRKHHDAIFFVFAAGMLIAAIHHGGSAMAFALSTMAWLWIAGKWGALCTWGDGAMLQYFGRISYSLYLVHLVVLSCVMRAGYKLTTTNAIASVGWLVLAALASIGVAHLLFAFVERPTMRWASSLKHRLDGKTSATIESPRQPLDAFGGTTPTSAAASS